MENNKQSNEKEKLIAPYNSTITNNDILPVKPEEMGSPRLWNDMGRHERWRPNLGISMVWYISWSSLGSCSTNGIPR